jgi:SAM-dependent methyltransferase
MATAAEPGCSPLSRRALIDLASLRGGDSVVALGRADCRDGARVAQLVGPAGRVILVATGQEPFEPPEANAGAWPRAIVRGDLAAIGLRSSIADVVLSNCALLGRADRPGVYREIHRVLKPGGRFVTSDVIALHAVPRGAYGAPRARSEGGGLPESDYLAAVQACGFERVTLLQRTAPYEERGRIMLSLTLEAVRG